MNSSRINPSAHWEFMRFANFTRFRNCDRVHQIRFRATCCSLYQIAVRFKLRGGSISTRKIDRSRQVKFRCGEHTPWDNVCGSMLKRGMPRVLPLSTSSLTHRQCGWDRAIPLAAPVPWCRRWVRPGSTLMPDRGVRAWRVSAFSCENVQPVWAGRWSRDGGKRTISPGLLIKDQTESDHPAVSYYIAISVVLR